jgi:hypothetical protein
MKQKNKKQKNPTDENRRQGKALNKLA